MCQICTLVLRSHKISKNDSRLLNPKPLSVLVTLNGTSTKNKSQRNFNAVKA